LKSVGPNATLVDIEAVIRGLKAKLAGEIAVSGPDLARSLTDLGLIDEYRLYLHPVVLGRGKPFFAGPRPRQLDGDCDLPWRASIHGLLAKLIAVQRYVVAVAEGLPLRL
jgi:riboflavin biosynthesis pyrimidine reductase